MEEKSGLVSRNKTVGASRRRVGLWFVLLVQVIWLYGCSTLTVDEIRENGKRFEFVTEQRYQHVFENVLRNARACYSDSFRFKQVAVSGHRSNAARIGVVTVTYLFGPLAEDVRLLIDVESTGSKETSVRASYAGRLEKRGAKAVETWLDKRQDPSCEV